MCVWQPVTVEKARPRPATHRLCQRRDVAMIALPARSLANSRIGPGPPESPMPPRYDRPAVYDFGPVEWWCLRYYRRARHGSSVNLPTRAVARVAPAGKMVDPEGGTF